MTRGHLRRTGLVIAFVLGAASFVYYVWRPTRFQASCRERLRENKYQKSLENNLCAKLEREFFSSRSPIQAISPTTVHAPALPIDHRVRFIAFYDPLHLSSFAYCYFVFRGWFDPKTLSPRQLGQSASGFAILKSELNGYPEWLKTSKGAECTKSLKDSIVMDPSDLTIEMADRVSIIGFNPVGAVRSDDGLDAVLKEALLTINHERIHAIHVSCPEVDRVAVRHWDSLSRASKEKLKAGHLNYDWTNRTVAVREAFAYFLEDNPEKVWM